MGPFGRPVSFRAPGDNVRRRVHNKKNHNQRYHVRIRIVNAISLCPGFMFFGKVAEKTEGSCSQEGAPERASVGTTPAADRRRKVAQADLMARMGTRPAEKISSCEFCAPKRRVCEIMELGPFLWGDIVSMCTSNFKENRPKSSNGFCENNHYPHWGQSNVKSFTFNTPYITGTYNG